jgi:hypothetical protein
VRLDLDLRERGRLTGTFNYEGQSFREAGVAGVLDGAPGAPPGLTDYSRQPCQVRCRVAYGGWRWAGAARAVVFRPPKEGAACLARCDAEDQPLTGRAGTYHGRLTGTARGTVSVAVAGAAVTATVRIGERVIDATGALAASGAITFHGARGAERLRFEGHLDEATYTFAGR